MELAIAKISNKFKLLLHLQECTQCGRRFLPILDMGTRSCSFHPESAHGESLSATQYLRGQGTSKGRHDHYPCCGAAVLQYFRRDLAHDFYTPHMGCTASDHNATLGWKTLIGLEEHEFFVSLNGGVSSISHRETLKNTRDWLVMCPFNYLEYIYQIRKQVVLPSMTPDNALYPADADVDFVTWVLGILRNNFIFISSIENLLDASNQSILYRLPAGGKNFYFDAMEAYFDMLSDFVLPRWSSNAMASMTTTSRHLIDPASVRDNILTVHGAPTPHIPDSILDPEPAFPQFQPASFIDVKMEETHSARAILQAYEDEDQTNTSSDEIQQQNNEESGRGPVMNSNSALAQALSMIGIKRAAQISHSPSIQPPTKKARTDSYTDHDLQQQRPAYTEKLVEMIQRDQTSALGVLQTRLFDTFSTARKQDKINMRNDLYSHTADEIIMKQNNIHSKHPLGERIISGNPINNQRYLSFVAPTHTHLPHETNKPYEGLARDYLQLFDEYFRALGGRNPRDMSNGDFRKMKFIPFVIFTWMDPEPAPHPSIRSEKACTHTNDIFSFPPLKRLHIHHTNTY